MTELLAPAGSREGLAAAVENGADAVYLAGKRFGARANAENFDEEALTEAIRYAHLRGVAVHVAVNTAVWDDEISEVAEYIRFLYEAGADAILVQDLGVAAIAKRLAPRLPLHASTQMTVHSLAGARALSEAGFSRIVLSRELSVDEIRYIAGHVSAETEVFIHGALCVCWSGQCLMSSMIGGRSGNRGLCAQPCRLPYSLTDETGLDVPGGASERFILSPKDLCAVTMLPSLVDAGVTSFKIEGRMKRPEYVAVVTDVYRRTLDRVLAGDFSVSEEDMRRLSQIYSRDFTTAYLSGTPGRDMMSASRPNNRGLPVGRVLSYDAMTHRAVVKLTERVSCGDEIDFWVSSGGRVPTTLREMLDERGESVSEACAGSVVSLPVSRAVHPHDRMFRVLDVKLTEEARESYRTRRRVIRISMRARAHMGEHFVVEATADDGASATAVSDFVVERAKKTPTEPDAIRKQLGRLGDTVYRTSRLDVDIDGDVMIPASVMNATRRKLTASLDEERHKKYIRPPLDHETTLTPPPSRKTGRERPLIIVASDTTDAAVASVRAGADGVLFGGDSYSGRMIPADDYRRVYEVARSSGRLFFINTPRILREGFTDYLVRLMDEAGKFSPDAVYVHNIGTLTLVRESSDFPIHTDFSIITGNVYTIGYLMEMGASGVTLSPELTMGDVAALAKRSPLPTECIVYGRTELMVSAYCAVGSFIGKKAGDGSCTASCHGGRFFLKDRIGAMFPVVTDAFCQMHILNSRPMSMLPYLAKLGRLGIERLRVDGRYLSAEELSRVVKNHREALSYGTHPEASELSRIAQMEGEGFTRGHFFRGTRAGT